LIRQSAELNEFRNVEVLQLACGDRSGVATLRVPQGGSGNGSLYRDFAELGPQEEVEVRVQRFDEIIGDRPLAGNVVLKLDVEGAELTFIDGAARLLESRRPLIVIEVNPVTATAAGYAVQDVFTRLRNLGYDTAVELERDGRRVRLDEADAQTERNIAVIDGRMHRGPAA
jgi:FkbM family methyltransferase